MAGLHVAELGEAPVSASTDEAAEENGTLPKARRGARVKRTAKVRVNFCSLCVSY